MATPLLTSARPANADLERKPEPAPACIDVHTAVTHQLTDDERRCFIDLLARHGQSAPDAILLRYSEPWPSNKSVMPPGQGSKGARHRRSWDRILAEHPLVNINGLWPWFFNLDADNEDECRVLDAIADECRRLRLDPIIDLSGIAPETVAQLGQGRDAEVDPDGRRWHRHLLVLVEDPPTCAALQALLERLNGENGKMHRKSTAREPFGTHRRPEWEAYCLTHTPVDAYAALEEASQTNAEMLAAYDAWDAQQTAERQARAERVAAQHRAERAASDDGAEDWTPAAMERFIEAAIDGERIKIVGVRVNRNTTAQRRVVAATRFLHWPDGWPAAFEAVHGRDLLIDAVCETGLPQREAKDIVDHAIAYNRTDHRKDGGPPDRRTGKRPGRMADLRAVYEIVLALPLAGGDDELAVDRLVRAFIGHAFEAGDRNLNVSLRDAWTMSHVNFRKIGKLVNQEHPRFDLFIERTHTGDRTKLADRSAFRMRSPNAIRELLTQEPWTSRYPDATETLRVRVSDAPTQRLPDTRTRSVSPSRCPGCSELHDLCNPAHNLAGSHRQAALLPRIRGFGDGLTPESFAERHLTPEQATAKQIAAIAADFQAFAAVGVLARGDDGCWRWAADEALGRELHERGHDGHARIVAEVAKHRAKRRKDLEKGAAAVAEPTDVDDDGRPMFWVDADGALCDSSGDRLDVPVEDGPPEPSRTYRSRRAAELNLLTRGLSSGGLTADELAVFFDVLDRPDDADNAVLPLFDAEYQLVA